jgi:hypothetical protein
MAYPNYHSDSFHSRSQGEDRKARKKGANRNERTATAEK